MYYNGSPNYHPKNFIKSRSSKVSNHQGVRKKHHDQFKARDYYYTIHTYSGLHGVHVVESKASVFSN
jgi:hypothetical protein